MQYNPGHETRLPLSVCVAFAEERGNFGRSMVITQQEIVSTSQTLAANAVLGITEPMMNGIGGDLFVIYREASGKVHGLNASGWAPQAMSIQSLAAKGVKSRFPDKGIHSVTVPGGGTSFDLDPKLPSAVAPRKRPFHTITPAYLEKGDEHIGFGIMGGPNQPLVHAQESARFTKRNSTGCDVSIESRVKIDDLQKLSAMGHVIAIQPQHVNYGAADSRADGSAEPEPGTIR